MDNEIMYAIIKDSDGYYSFKYVGNLNKKDDVMVRDISAQQATAMCNEYNEKLLKKESTSKDEQGIERTVDPSELGDHHGREPPFH